MSLWRRTAIERFPQLHRAIADAEDAGWVWYEISHALEDVYRRTLLDEKFVATVYEYASWCLHHRSLEVRTAVVLWFYEGLPGNTLIRPDMARWLSEDDFDLLEFAWAYVLSDENRKSFQQEFAARKAEFQGIATRHQRNLLKRVDKAQSSVI